VGIRCVPHPHELLCAPTTTYHSVQARLHHPRRLHLLGFKCRSASASFFVCLVLFDFGCLLFVCFVVCVCLFVCLYVCMFFLLYVCMFVCLYVCMFVCLYVVCLCGFVCVRPHQTPHFKTHNNTTTHSTNTARASGATDPALCCAGKKTTRPPNSASCCARGVCMPSTTMRRPSKSSRWLLLSSFFLLLLPSSSPYCLLALSIYLSPLSLSLSLSLSPLLSLSLSCLKQDTSQNKTPRRCRQRSNWTPRTRSTAGRFICKLLHAQVVIFVRTQENPT